jgi:hypothetical protein
MKRIILPVLLLVVPSLAHAVICKTVQPDGTVSYADVPAAECEQPVKLPDYSRYAPRPIQQRAAPATDSRTAPAQPAFAGYSAMRIVQPEADGTVRDNEGRVAVSIALQPPLQEGHSVRLLVDGRPVPGSFKGLDIELSGIERGTHQIRAEVVDGTGRQLISTASVPFTLRKAALSDGRGSLVPKPLPVPSPSGG